MRNPGKNNFRICRSVGLLTPSIYHVTSKWSYFPMWYILHIVLFSMYICYVSDEEVLINHRSRSSLLVDDFLFSHDVYVWTVLLLVTHSD